MITLKSYLCGAWRAGNGAGYTLVNPTTEEPIATASTAGLDLVSALKFARTVGGPALRRMTFADRGALLQAASERLQEAREALIEVSILNGGTTRSDAKFDIDGAIGTLGYYAKLGATLGNRTLLIDGDAEQLARSPRFYGYHVRMPLQGAAIHINAFNFPAWGMAEKAAVALLAGVPVITKPATSTALLAYRAMEQIVAGEIFPEGTWQFVCGSLGSLLDALTGQDIVAFTGSAHTAQSLRKLDGITRNSVRMNVEADSVNAAILGSDVAPGDDLYAMFLRDVVREMRQKAGQKCTATRRIFVDAAQIDQVQADLSEHLAQLKIGNPANDAVQIGPLATADQRRDAQSGLARLIESGAKLIYGTPVPTNMIDVPTGKGYFVGPCLLRADDAQKALTVHQHEVFAPVATLMPFSSQSELFSSVALGEGGLVLSVYTNDRAFLTEALTALAPFHGRIFVGSAKVSDVATPVGAVLPSCIHGGPGRAGGGEELGGIRGLSLYQQRTAIQGDRGLLEKALGIGE